MSELNWDKGLTDKMVKVMKDNEHLFDNTHVYGYYTEEDRGNCHFPNEYGDVFIAIIKDISEDYLEYYICHELSHHANRIENGQDCSKYDSHNERFREIFEEICDKRLWVFEDVYSKDITYHNPTIKGQK